ncbi:hypothetical protein A6395_07660 [Exiguobacterium sp. SH31]|nr:hypothetical protein A6395_07660 [Exiguobacterium sp. SH31]TCI59119.1 transposase [Exiguobacterium sp. SH0S2]
MNEKFVKSIYKTIVEGNIVSYKDMYEEELDYSKLKKSEMNIYWKKQDEFYKSLSAEQKEIIFSMLKVVMVDTISHVFGIIDGSSGLVDFEVEPKLLLDSVDSEGYLQDLFLGYIEDENLLP